MSAPFIEIDGRRIGADYPPYVICELSGNHNGSLDRCLEMVDAAAETARPRLTGAGRAASLTQG